VSPEKTAEPIEMPFGVETRLGSSNRALDGVQFFHGKGPFLEGRGRVATP